MPANYITPVPATTLLPVPANHFDLSKFTVSLCRQIACASSDFDLSIHRPGLAPQVKIPPGKAQFSPIVPLTEAESTTIPPRAHWSNSRSIRRERTVGRGPKHNRTFWGMPGITLLHGNTSKSNICCHCNNYFVSALNWLTNRFDISVHTLLDWPFQHPVNWSLNQQFGPQGSKCNIPSIFQFDSFLSHGLSTEEFVAVVSEMFLL